MNFSNIENTANEGTWITINVPGVEESGVRFKILGKDSDAYRNKQKAMMDRRIKNRRMKVTADDLEEEGRSLLATCVADWEGVEDDNGALDCNYANVKKLLIENPFIQEQIDEAIGDRESFLKI